MLKIREAVIVEGRYDKIKLSSIVDAPIIETNGFRVFSDKEKQSLIRKIAETRGILIMTDSDGAGFVIRNFLKGSVDNSKIKNCYIPQIKGKEKRKAKGGKEGLLGVEGVSNEVIINAIRKSGAEIIGEENNIPERNHCPRKMLHSRALRRLFFPRCLNICSSYQINAPIYPICSTWYFLA